MNIQKLRKLVRKLVEKLNSDEKKSVFRETILVKNRDLIEYTHCTHTHNPTDIKTQMKYQLESAQLELDHFGVVKSGGSIILG